MVCLEELKFNMNLYIVYCYRENGCVDFKELGEGLW